MLVRTIRGLCHGATDRALTELDAKALVGELCIWWAHVDLNHGPHPYQGDPGGPGTVDDSPNPLVL